MTISDELRQAAAHIREVAGSTIPGPWLRLGQRTVISSDGRDVAGANPAEGAHIVLWSPDVAELVAVLLEDVACEQDAAIEFWHGKAVELARAINAKAGAA